MRISRGPILIVEDDPGLRNALRQLLEEAGYFVAAATNGRDALQLLGAITKPALVLLDLFMPVMSGAAFLESVRRTPAHADLRSIVLSVEEPPAKISVLADGFLIKPFPVEDLVALIERQLGRPRD